MGSREHNIPIAETAAGESQREKRDRIIEQAILMFNRVGYDGVRVSDITDSLDMGKGTFYLYFRNKRELLLACFDHVSELVQVLEALPQIREGDFFTKIRPRVQLIHQYNWYPGLINLVRAAETSQDQEIKKRAREAYEAIAGPIRRDLEAAVEAGRARNVEVELAIYGFIGMTEDVCFRSRLDDSYSLEEVADFMTDAAMRLLSAEAAQEDPQDPHPRTHIRARLVDRGGTDFDLLDVRCNGESRVTGALGLAEVDVDLSRVSTLVTTQTAEGCVACLCMDDETNLQLHVNGSTVVSGTSPLGTVRIALRDVSILTLE
ncbi:MAG: TetR/AcrR family transcriptional regulator [Thermoleophilia bacterium]|jgi:AcrR family transcriptional regulator